MNFNWKRFIAIIIIVIVTATAVGLSTWYSLTKAINDQRAQISSLENEASILADNYAKKVEEQKAKEAAEKAAAEQAAAEAQKAPTTTKKVSPTSTPAPVPAVTILYFYDPACGTCQAQTPIVLELQSEGVPFSFMNVAANPSYISQYGISLVPTFILNGVKQAAFFTKPELLNFWNTYK